MYVCMFVCLYECMWYVLVCNACEEVWAQHCNTFLLQAMMNAATLGLAMSGSDNWERHSNKRGNVQAMLLSCRHCVFTCCCQVSQFYV